MTPLGWLGHKTSTQTNSYCIFVEHGNPGNQAAYYIGLYADFIKNLPVIFRPSYTVNSTEYPELLPPSADVNWLNGENMT